MNLDTLTSIVTRLFFLGAFALLSAAVLERLANVLGYTFLRGYTPGRLIEFAAVLLIFIIAVLLRQVRDAVRQTSA